MANLCVWKHNIYHLNNLINKSTLTKFNILYDFCKKKILHDMLHDMFFDSTRANHEYYDQKFIFSHDMSFQYIKCVYKTKKEQLKEFKYYDVIKMFNLENKLNANMFIDYMSVEHSEQCFDLVRIMHIYNKDIVLKALELLYNQFIGIDYEIFLKEIIEKWKNSKNEVMDTLINMLYSKNINYDISNSCALEIVDSIYKAEIMNSMHKVEFFTKITNDIINRKLDFKKMDQLLENSEVAKIIHDKLIEEINNGENMSYCVVPNDRHITVDNIQNLLRLLFLNNRQKKDNKDNNDNDDTNSCPVCICSPIDTSLLCGHCFCLKCVYMLVKPSYTYGYYNNGGYVSCPICKQPNALTSARKLYL